MSLTDSRNRTYTTATPVDPNDMNDLQDVAVGAKHGPVWRWLSPRDAVEIAGTVSDRQCGTGLTVSAPSTLLKTLDLVEGSLVHAMQIRYKGATAGAASLTVYLIESEGDNAGTSSAPVGNISINDVDNNSHTSAVCTFTAPHEVQAAKSYDLDIGMQTGQKLYAIGLLISNPL